MSCLSWVDDKASEVFQVFLTLQISSATSTRMIIMMTSSTQVEMRRVMNRNRVWVGAHRWLLILDQDSPDNMDQLHLRLRSIHLQRSAAYREDQRWTIRVYPERVRVFNMLQRLYKDKRLTIKIWTEYHYLLMQQCSLIYHSSEHSKRNQVLKKKHNFVIWNFADKFQTYFSMNVNEL